MLPVLNQRRLPNPRIGNTTCEVVLLPQEPNIVQRIYNTFAMIYILAPMPHSSNEDSYCSASMASSMYSSLSQPAGPAGGVWASRTILEISSRLCKSQAFMRNTPCIFDSHSCRCICYMYPFSIRAQLERFAASASWFTYSHTSMEQTSCRLWHIV